tara:strand:- start:37 stop:696 length:660 start_codon:yes stop_codon:yes gene_type:complete
MKIINVYGYRDASSIIFDSIKLNEKKYQNFNIAFTGGRFGKYFWNFLRSEGVDYDKWKLFLTDERLVADKNSLNSKIFNSSFSNTVNLIKNFYFFRGDIDKEKNYFQILKALNEIKIEAFHFTMMSLGEDGHLAGQFNNSSFFDDRRMCYTLNASTLPKERISFSVPWLLKSKIVYILVLEENKTIALNNLIRGDGIFDNKIFNQKNIVFLKNKDIHLK